MVALQVDAAVDQREAVAVSGPHCVVPCLLVFSVLPIVVVHAPRAGFLERIPLDALDHLCSVGLLEAELSRH